MASLDVLNVMTHGVDHDLTGLSALGCVEVGGQIYLVTAAQASGSVQLYHLADGHTLTLSDQLTADSSRGTDSISDIAFAHINGDVAIIPLSGYEDQATFIDLVDGGAFGASEDWANAMGRVTSAASVTSGATQFVLAATRNGDGLYLMRWATDGALVDLAGIADNATMSLGDIVAIDSLTIGARTYIFTASQFDAGLHSIRLRENGRLRERDHVLPDEQSGFSLVSDLQAIDAPFGHYVVMAASGTDSLTVYEVTANGKLREVDHVQDSLDTRFEQVSSLTSIVHEGRVFIAAAGSDDGVSILELMPNGQLIELMSIADDFDTTLDNVSSLAFVELDGEIRLFVGSGSEHGFTDFLFTPDPTGATILGGAGRDSLTGTAQNDVIFGGKAGDTIHGGAGDDYLDGGRGKDILYGGAGRDTFVFAPDTRKDIIADYEIGIDQIDLSAYAQVENLDDLTIKSRAFGALIIIRGEQLVIRTDDGSRLSEDDFSADDFVF